ncbi:transposase [Nonomuraea sp. NPDC049784]|uniref:transposase n=1 Tax=Nonomuraea sp. NPDC049784 TaxID=3154361 RepID=UPI0033E736BC
MKRSHEDPARPWTTAIAGPVADPGQAGSFYRGLRTVALDGTHLHAPDDEQVTWRYPKRSGDVLEFGYPLERLLVVVECGTGPCSRPASAPRTKAKYRTHSACWAAWTARCCCWRTPVSTRWSFCARWARQARSSWCAPPARRRPAVQRRLPNGSYLARLCGVHRASEGYRALPVRVIEAWITVTLADGTTRREPWRLVTSLVDHERYPAGELVALYHRRWQAETAYFSIKVTMLDGRVLRSRSVAGLDQEVYALLTVYQALIRTAADAATSRPGLVMERISFTILLQTARDQVTTATGILPPEPVALVGAIGRAVLNDLLPAERRQRVKARSRKNPTSKYGPNAGKHPQQAQTYTLEVQIQIMDHGLASRRRR